MVVGEIPVSADLVVVGGGPGGYTAALRAAELGREVLLVDRDGVDGLGGACLHVGCIPSKALIEVAHHMHQGSALSAAGVPQIVDQLDMPVWQRWKDGVVDGLTRGVQQLLRAAGITVIEGQARLSRPDQLVVHDPQRPLAPAHYFQFADLVLATGSRPSALAVLPCDGVRILDSSDALALDRVPGTVAVVGAGYIGLELGTALAKLGAQVVLVEQADRVLPGMDASLARPVQRRLTELGVEVLPGSTVIGDDGTSLHVATPSGERALPVEVVLVAIGRTPNTEDLGLETAGVILDARGLVPVAADRRASAHIAAIGDIVAGPALAHKASSEAVVAVDALCGRAAAFAPAVIPLVVFSDPEIATAGLSLAAARSAGIDAAHVTVPVASSGRAATMGVRQGSVELVWDRDGDTVIGVHIVGPQASELIAEGVLAIEMAATLEDLAATIHTHPTLAEMLGDAARRARLAQPLAQ